MKVSITFRKADKDDIYFLLALRKRTMDKYLADAGIDTSEKYHLSRINEHYDDSNIILCDGQVIGLLKLGVLQSSVHVRQFQILPEFQKRGIGEQVMQLVKKKAKELNLPITLNVLLNNPAKRLYLRLGFQEVGKNELEFQFKYVEPEKETEQNLGQPITSNG